MKYRIFFTGKQNVEDFCRRAARCEDEICLTNGDSYRVNAKSILGCFLASSEWKEVWIESDFDYYTTFEPWIEPAADDGNFIHE